MKEIYDLIAEIVRQADPTHVITKIKNQTLDQQDEKMLGVYIREGVGDKQYLTGEYAWETSKIHLELIGPQNQLELFKCISVMRKIIEVAETIEYSKPTFELISLDHTGSKVTMIGKNANNREVMVSNMLLRYRVI